MKLEILLILLSIYCVETKNEANSLEKVCRNINNEAVDYYAIFFFPKSTSIDNSIYYAYYDPTLTSFEYYKYFESNFPPTKITSYITKYSETEKINYFLWNDDITLKNSESKNAPTSRAHAKGTLVYNYNKGAFLLHSMPRYPTRDINNDILLELPSNSGIYGQSFLCITLNKSDSEKIAEILNYINIMNNKSVNIDKVNSKANSWITKLISNKFDRSYPSELVSEILSYNNKKFKFISKNYLNKITPFDTTLTKMYDDDFYVRTWIRPEGAPAVCSGGHKLLNVKSVRFNNFEFNDSKEHSKWAVAKNKNVVCFSDLNHVPSQQNRGGNIVCFEDSNLSKLMRNSITETDNCEEKKEENIGHYIDVNKFLFVFLWLCLTMF